MSLSEWEKANAREEFKGKGRDGRKRWKERRREGGRVERGKVGPPGSSKILSHSYFLPVSPARQDSPIATPFTYAKRQSVRNAHYSHRLQSDSLHTLTDSHSHSAPPDSEKGGCITTCSCQLLSAKEGGRPPIITVFYIFVALLCMARVLWREKVNSFDTVIVHNREKCGEYREVR